MEVKVMNEKEYIDKICVILKVKKINVEQYVDIKDVLTEFAVKVTEIALGLITELVEK
jgi:hypothetical protein